MSNESTVIIIGDDECDESKCASHGLKDLFNNSPTCYSSDSILPMACAEGYIAHPIGTEPIIAGGFGWGSNGLGDVPNQYHTCCPPDLPPDVNVSRHCSNSTLAFDNDTALICQDDARPHLRQMAAKLAPRSKESFMCCDSVVDNKINKSNNFLNDAECIPFRTEIFETTTALNQYGKIDTIYCKNNKGIYSDFRFPKKIEKNNSNGRFWYECCKTESTTLQHFVHDTTFELTVYPQIVVSTIAVFSCTLLIFALIIPLFLHLKQLNTKSTNTSTQGSTTPAYNGFVLYILFLTLSDLILNIYLLGMFSSYANDNYNPNFTGAIVGDSSLSNDFEASFVLLCSNANLFLNCVVSNELLILLRNSYNAIQYNPPSLLKVTLQAMAVYLFSILIFVIHYLVKKAAKRLKESGDREKSEHLILCNLIWSLVVSYALPLTFFSYVWLTIWYRGYTSSVNAGKKQLTWYFLRIFIVFNLIWLPGQFLIIFGGREKLYFGYLAAIGFLFCGLQAIISTCMAMMKADVWKYTRDLITLSYIRKKD